MSDYEQALQGALANLFPEADVLGCWFHYSQVSELLKINCFLAKSSMPLF